jgi:predicted transcriptional regulator
MSQQHPLDTIADIFEKSAEYIQALEVRSAELEKIASKVHGDVVEKKATVLKEKLQTVMGKSIDDAMISKLAASSDPAVSALLEKLSSFDEAEELGSSMDTQTKTAANLPPEDDHFLSWVLK